MAQNCRKEHHGLLQGEPHADAHARACAERQIGKAIDRLALYLIPLQMFVLSRLPEAFGNGERPNGQVVLGVIAYSAIIQFTWLNYAQNSNFWIPYKLFPLGTQFF